VVESRVELHTLLLCDHAITAQDGKVSAIGVFSQINVARLPAVTARFFIVAVLEADAGSHQVTLQVVGPGGGDLLPRPPMLTMQVPANARNANIVADLKGLQVRELGRHRIELRAGERVLGSTPLTVNLVLPQPHPATA
jgi:hypothetical protein